MEDSEKYTIKKSFSRDTTLFTQSLWAQSIKEFLKKERCTDDLDFLMFAHLASDGIVEIWENESAVNWLLDSLLLISQKQEKFIFEILDEYKVLLDKINNIQNKKLPLIKQDLIIYRQLIYQAVMRASLFFYIGADDRHSKNVIKIALEGRELYDFFSATDSFIRNQLQESYSISHEQAALVLPNEIFDPPNKEALFKRQKGFVVVDGEISFLGLIQDLSHKYPKYIFENDQPVDTGEKIKGQVAFQGLVSGVAKIVKKQSDLIKVNSGDIMVSPMTTPDFVSAMNLSSAFVTDEGGITCHAAIVAREMKKPCVIGTKIATKVIKDGDFIKVDAIKGLIKIIKTNN